MRAESMLQSDASAGVMNVGGSLPSNFTVPRRATLDASRISQTETICRDDAVAACVMYVAAVTLLAAPVADMDEAMRAAILAGTNRGK